MSDQRLRLRIQAAAQRERNWSFQQPFDIFQCSFDWICISIAYLSQLNQSKVDSLHFLNRVWIDRESWIMESDMF